MIGDHQAPHVFGDGDAIADLRLPPEVEVSVDDELAGKLLHRGQELAVVIGETTGIVEGLEPLVRRLDKVGGRGNLGRARNPGALQQERLPARLVKAFLEVVGLALLDPVGTETVDLSDEATAVIVDLDVGDDVFAIVVRVDLRMAPEAERRFVGVETDAADRGRQVEIVGRKRAIGDHLPTFHGVETGIEHRRMEMVIGDGVFEPLGRDDLGEGLAILAPDVLEVLEERTELVAGLLVILVILLVREMARQAGLDRIEVGRGIDRHRELAQDPLGIEIPILVFTGGAEDLEDLCRRIKDNLDRRHLLLGDEEGLLHLEILDRVVLPGEKLAGDSEPDLAVAGGREDDAVPETVVVEPGKIAGIQIKAPGRTGRGLGEAEERMLDRSAAKVVSLGRLEPETLVLPGVGGQADDFAAALIDRLPVDRVAVQMETSEVAEHFLGFVGLALEAGEIESLPVLIGKALHDGILERRVGSDLEEGIFPGSDQAGDGGGEEDRLADVLPPVLRVKFGAVADPAGDGGNVGNARGERLDILQHREEFLPDRLHLVGVESVIDAKPADEFALSLESGDDFLERRGVSRERDHAGAVDHRDLDLVLFPGDGLAGLRLGKADRDHAALAAGHVLETRAVVDHLHRVFERVGTGHVGGGDFTDGVSDHFRGTDAPRFPEFGQGDLESKDGWLGDVRAIDLRRGLVARHLFDEGPARERLQVGVDLFEDLAEDWLALDEFLTHRPPLGSLTGEDKDERMRLGDGAPRKELTAAIALGEPLGETMNEVLAVFCDDGETVIVVLSLTPGGGGDFAESFIGGTEEATPADHGVAQGVVGAGRDRQENGAIDRLCARHRLLRLWRRFKEDVRVRPAKTEAVHPDHRREITEMRQGLQFGRDLELELLEGNVRIWPLEIQIARDLVVVEDKGRLGKTGDTGTRLEVTDIGFHRANETVIPLVAAAREHDPERAGLDRIPDRGARAVGLHVADLLRLDPRPRESVLEHFGLGLDAGDGHRGGVTILIDNRRANHAIDAVTIALGVRQLLDRENPRPFPADVTVGAVVEGKTLPGGRKHRRLGEADRGIGGQEGVDPARERHRRFARPDALAGQVDGDESRGASRVDGNSWSFKIKEIRNPVRSD